MKSPLNLPKPDAAGNFGVDPVTGAPITDRFVAQEYLNPSPGTLNTVGSYMARSTPPMPAMMPRGGGGGGGGRMGPQNEKPIMNVGPRTGSDYVAKHGGLSPQRPSALDAQYAMGNLTDPRAAEWLNNQPKPAAAPLPANDSFAGGAGMGMGAAVGQAMVPGVFANNDRFNAPDFLSQPGRLNISPSGNDSILSPGPDDQGFDMSSFGYNDDGASKFAQDATQFALGSLPGQKAPTPMAKGGSMHPGKKPYLVGEEGPELILPRKDGSGFVLPADVTAQVLPAMRDVTPKAKGGKMGYTPRAEGGEIMLERQGDLGTMRGFLTPSGSGFAEVQNEVGAEPIMPIDKFFADPSSNYQLDPTRPGMPLMPDAVSGPWAERAMPVTPEMRQDLRSNTLGNFMALAAMPDTQRVVDPRQAMRERGIEAMADLGNIRYEQEQARVQRDLAARAARAPLGTPTAPQPAMGLPGMPPISPGAAAALARNTERLMRSPEGAMLAMQQQQRQAELAQRSQLAATAIPVTNPATGEILGYTTGTGGSLPMPGTTGRTVRRQAEVNGQWMNFFDDGSVEPVDVPGASPENQPVLAWDGSRVVTLPANTDTASLPMGLTLLPSKGREAGGAKTDTTKPGAAKPAATTPEGKSRVKALMDRRKQAAGTGGVSG